MGIGSISNTPEATSHTSPHVFKRGDRGLKQESMVHALRKYIYGTPAGDWDMQKYFSGEINVGGLSDPVSLNALWQWRERIETGTESDRRHTDSSPYLGRGS